MQRKRKMPERSEGGTEVEEPEGPMKRQNWNLEWTSERNCHIQSDGVFDPKLWGGDWDPSPKNI